MLIFALMNAKPGEHVQLQEGLLMAKMLILTFGLSDEPNLCFVWAGYLVLREVL